jgi:dTDP-4-amino-4,6-dideoxygalactose transaminase
MDRVSKTSISDLAYFGGPPLFQKVRSISNLVRPNIERFLYYAKQSYDSGWLTNNGPMVRLLEGRLAQIHGTEYCIAMCNGLWALILCARCLALENKNEVIMASMTYRRMGDIAAWLQLVPHYCDIDGTSFGLSTDAAERAINENTALILAAHPIVNLLNISDFEALSSRYGIPLLIDSVEAAYATHQGKMVGQFGEAECFSMHASKFLNGFEAGYVTTNNGSLAQRLQLMRAFGFSGPDRVIELGFNAKLNEFHAAMALAAIDDIPDQIERNRCRYLRYKEFLSEIEGLELITFDESELRTYKNILVMITPDWPLARSDLIELLHAENMLSRPYYFPPLHDKTASYPSITGAMPETNKLKHKLMMLPSGEFVSIEDIDRIREFLTFLSLNGAEIASRLSREKS